jgi:hypothetical protein
MLTVLYHHWFDLDSGLRLDWGSGGAGKTKTCPGTNFFGGNTVRKFQNSFLPLLQVEITKEVRGMNKTWQQKLGEKALDELHEKGLVNTPDVWKARDLEEETTPLWLFFEMMNRITEGWKK